MSGIYFVKLIHTPQSGPNKDIPEDITQYGDFDKITDVSASRAIEIKSNKFELSLNNVWRKFVSAGVQKFRKDDIIEVYASWSPITLSGTTVTSTDALIITASIEGISQTMENGNRVIKLSCVDKTYIMLKAPWAKNYDNKTVDYIIKNIVQQISETGTGGYFVNALTVNDITGQSTTLSAGIAAGDLTIPVASTLGFPSIGVVTVDSEQIHYRTKTASTFTNVIRGNNYSTAALHLIGATVRESGYVSDLTTFGSALPTIYYSDIFKPSYEVMAELSQTTNTNENRPYIFWIDRDNFLHWRYPVQTVISTTIVEGTEGLYRINCDLEKQDTINMIIFYGGTDKNDIGILWYAFDETTTLTDLRMQFFDWNSISRDMKVDNPNYAGWTNTQFRTAVKTAGVAQAKTYFSSYGEPVNTANLELRGTTSFKEGDLVSVTIPTNNIIALPMRVSEITHMFTTNGWFTQLSLKEDPLAITT